jgi:3-oxoacyl-[acyl-carrier protein] reductase
MPTWSEAVEEGEFYDKAILVTGAGSGVGSLLTEAFAAQGARVAANDLTPINLDQTISMIEASGGRAHAFLADVSKKMAVQNMVEQVRDIIGGIDILINCANVRPSHGILGMDEWAWDRTLAVNLKGPFLTMQSVGRVMADQGGGIIVNMCADIPLEPQRENQIAYETSKAGLIGLTREAARELTTYNIRVHAVCPLSGKKTSGSGREGEDSGMEAWMSLQSRIHPGAPSDLVGMVFFLCSRVTRDWTGQVMLVETRKVME